MSKLGQEPAFPIPDYIMENCGAIDFNPMGMSKRFYAACAAMQGILSNPNGLLGVKGATTTPDSLIENCYILADELLKQEKDDV